MWPLFILPSPSFPDLKLTLGILSSSSSENGSVAERFKAAVLKTAVGVTLP